MNVNDALRDLFERIRPLVHQAVGDLDAPALAWRPDPQANSIAWLVWHLARVQDDHVAEIADQAQVWNDQWAERFGLPAGYADNGYGHTAEQVAAIAPAGPQVLTDYYDEVADQTDRYLQDAGGEEFDRVIDRSYDPPVTVGVRLLSVTDDSLQHVGQAAYLRGLHERRTPAGEERQTGGDVDLDELPAELRSRVDAATAHAKHRRIRRTAAGDGEPVTFLVEAVAGERVTVMDLSLRPDGSVAETTRSFQSADITDVRRSGGRVELVVGGGTDATTIEVSAEAAAAGGLLAEGADSPAGG